MPRSPSLPLLLLVLGCSDAPSAPAQPSGKPAAGAPATRPRRFFLPDRAPADFDPAAAGVTGTVAESMDAAGYTYLRLQTAQGETWAAVTKTAVERGAQVTIGNGTWMQDFESKTLGRRFDRILFGTLVGPATAPGAPADAMQAAHAGVQSGGAPLGEIKVDKAEGEQGRTIAEIHAAKATLKGQPVAVRGKVVKFNAGILGRNWLHVRDGTGSAAQQTDDLTVTTDDTVTLGDVVLVRGTLALDRDFGAGYRYPVIVEGAKVSK